MSKTENIGRLSNLEMKQIYAGQPCGGPDMDCEGISLCPLAQSGCLPGGACGAGNYHKEFQERLTYSVCKKGYPGRVCYDTKEYECILLQAFEDENCRYLWTIECKITGKGCEKLPAI